MKKLSVIFLMLSGCIEYEPASTLPPQGAPNERPLDVVTKRDKLVQVLPAEVDILWVIDDSCSMSEEQTALRDNYPVFMDFFLGSGLDYHIGVTSADTNLSFGGLDGTLVSADGVRWLDPSTPNPTDTFGRMAVLGTLGWNEHGRDAAYEAIEVKSRPGGINEGFYRIDSRFHIIAISDEEDQSYQIGKPEFIQYLNTVKWDDEMVTFSSIVTPTGGCPTGITPGNNYRDVTLAVGGELESICTQDWAPAGDKAARAASSIFLTKAFWDEARVRWRQWKVILSRWSSRQCTYNGTAGHVSADVPVNMKKPAIEEHTVNKLENLSR